MQAGGFKALGHPTRIRIVSILSQEGGKCVCGLVGHLGFDQSTVSRHLSVLKAAGILKSTKRGLKVRYEIAMRCVGRFLHCIGHMSDYNLEEPQRRSRNLRGAGQIPR
ncbi:MAG: ArsR/SmtB family transcription factor [Candidatus Fervidibacter sp.]|uniref:ArsR/SmtB family transcription factor n=1 Tax=Candidatus Fervidibacter sp. TaxID=3100871 RepID=UPI0040491A03